MEKSNHNDQTFNAVSNPEAKKPEAAKQSTSIPELTAVPNHALQDREIFLHGGVTRESAHSVILQMRALAKQNKEPITFWINSPGGTINDGLAIYDTMRDLISQGITIKTVAYGIAASMGSFLLSAGSPGHRTMLPCAIEMTHQPSGGYIGKEDGIRNCSKSMSETRDIMESHYAHFMGLDDEDEETRMLLKEYMSPDVYLNAYMAQRLGLIDNIAMQEQGKPQQGLKDEFLRKSIEIDIRLHKRQFDKIDTSRGSTDPRRFVKNLIEHRDNYLAVQAAKVAAPPIANDVGAAAQPNQP